jgi:hypothetical protein
MSDLEIRLREKQVERLPISKGEVLLSDLAARFPNLEDDIQQEHEARQFSVAPGTSLPSSFGGSLPSTPMEWKHSSSRPSSGKKGRKNATLVKSPVIRPATSDLIFDMDDDIEVGQGSPVVKHGKPPGKQPEVRNPWRDVNGKPLKEQPPVFSSDHRFRVLPESIAAVDDQESWSVVNTPGKGYGLVTLC